MCEITKKDDPRGKPGSPLTSTYTVCGPVRRGIISQPPFMEAPMHREMAPGEALPNMGLSRALQSRDPSLAGQGFEIEPCDLFSCHGHMDRSLPPCFL